MNKSIENLLALEDGWLDGEGYRYTPYLLYQFCNYFERYWPYRDQPVFFPTPFKDEVQLCYYMDGNYVCEIFIHLETLQGTAVGEVIPDFNFDFFKAYEWQKIISFNYLENPIYRKDNSV